MRAFLAVLVLLTLAFAGCASKEKDGDADGSTSESDSGTSSSSRSGSTSGTGTGAPSQNQAPTGSVGASTPGGALPLLVNFTLNGTDADGDALNWTLSFGDNSTNGTGSSLPVQVSHNYTSAGLFNATFTLTDGKANATYSQLVNVTGSAGTTAGQSVRLVWDIGLARSQSASSGAPYLDCADGPNKTFNYDSFTLEPATLGLPFTASIKATSGAQSIAGWTLYYNLADCSAYAKTFPMTGAGVITGVVPDNASPFVFAMADGGFLIEVQYRSGSQIV